MAKFTPTYGFLRPQCPSPTIAVSGGGNLAPGSGWFGIIRQNRSGFDIPSPLQQITWNAGQKIEINLPASMRVDDSEDVHRIWAIAASSNSLAQTQPLACWRGYWLNQIGTSGYFLESRKPLPATIELTHPSQTALGAVVANPAALQAIAQPIDGMQRFVTSLNKLFYYDPLSTRVVDNANVLNAGANPGRWLLWWFPMTTAIGAITDTTAVRGANRDIRALIDADILQPPPRYALDNTVSNWVNYTLFNGQSESGQPISAGTRLMLNVYQAGAIKSQLFNRRILCKVLGVSRFSDGSLSTAGLTVGQQLIYNYGDQIYTLEQDLQPGHGLSIAVALQCSAAELSGEMGSGAIAISFNFSQQAGAYNPSYPLTGDTIFAETDRRRILPKRGAIARVGAGGGTINWQSFTKKAAFDLVTPTFSASNQKIAIDGNGNVFWRGPNPLNPAELLRAIVSLQAGRSNPSPWSAYTLFAASSTANVTITYPTTIRANYPDAIAGSGVAQGAEFNAPFLVIYVQRQSDGQIREFANNAVLAAPNQQFAIADFVSGTVVGSLPSSPNEFGLWTAAAVPAIAQLAGGSLAADNYRFAYAFRYDGVTLSDISHKTADGCIPEAAASVGSLQDSITAIEATVSNLSVGSTKTTASFVQPTVGATVPVQIVTTKGRAIGEVIMIEVGGRYEVVSIDSLTQITLRNPSPVYPGNGAVGQTIPANSLVVASGIRGESGKNGANGYGLRYIFDSSTAPTPASGRIRFNNATLSAVTQIFISETDRNGANTGLALGLLIQGSQVQLIKDSDSDVYALYSVVSITDNGGDRTISVSFVGSSGVLAAADPVSMGLALRGQQGAIGLRGLQGSPGGYGLPYDFDSSTAPTPAFGRIRFNNADLSAVTQVFISEIDKNGSEVAIALSSLTPGSQIQVVVSLTQSIYVLFAVTANTDNGSNRTLAVVYVGSSGDITDNTEVMLGIAPRGPAGAPGSASGAAGLTLDNSPAPTTIATQSAIYRDSADGVVKLVGANNTPKGAIALTNQNQSYTRSQSVLSATLTDPGVGGAIAFDAALSNTFRLSFTSASGSRTLSNPSNAVDGQTIVILIKQNAGGTANLSFGSKYRFSGSNTITVAPNARDRLTCIYDAVDDVFDCVIAKGFV